MGKETHDPVRGERIKALRGARTQREISESAGISQPAYQKIEKGGGTTFWPQIAKALGTTADFILYGLPLGDPPDEDPYASDVVMPAIELLRKLDRLGVLDKKKIRHIMGNIRYVAGVAD